MTGTVYRVEHETDGQGCYFGRWDTSDFLFNMIDRHSGDTDGHPNPQNDIGIDRCMGEKEFCGFNSMESLQQWFTENDLIELEQLNFNVVELNDVKITAIGEKQVLFVKSEPEKICYNTDFSLDIEF